ncbi:hypothetical protein [Pseudomonas juntendi]|uniref:hypothetical protein n=1 Tax=Pseudomonas juntendi TaxID=2666183 RepID=UPI0024474614|nr:hypothetical protein [Pseudomonas juntendi]MDG9889732.1 hypothetical protein [Pseudomonas juntendi]
MVATEFAANFLCDFTLSDRDIELHEIAARYVHRTEEYDRSVCTGPIRSGEIQPATPYELGLVNRNAYRELDLLCNTHSGRYSRRDIIKAIQQHQTR